MAETRPPARPSKRPSQTPSQAPAKKSAPPRRATMEVQMAWLDPPAEEDEAAGAAPSEKPASSKKRPPRLPGSPRTLPPMPIKASVPPPPAPRQTMEVDMRWVELVDEPKPKPATAADVTKPRPIAKKPIRREE